MSAPVRRTQQERRAETIGRILDATIVSLGDRGYTSTTIGEVCRRSGVSSGGVFRHFPTRLDLMVAAAEEVADRQVAAFRTGLERLGDLGSDDSLDAIRGCLELLRDGCRAPINAAWYELLGAARTDDDLRRYLSPMVAGYHGRIRELGAALPIAARFEPATFEMILFSLVHLFDGEALSATVHAHPEQEDPRIEMLARLLVLSRSHISSEYDP